MILLDFQHWLLIIVSLFSIVFRHPPSANKYTVFNSCIVPTDTKRCILLFYVFQESQLKFIFKICYHSGMLYLGSHCSYSYIVLIHYSILHKERCCSRNSISPNFEICPFILVGTCGHNINRMKKAGLNGNSALIPEREFQEGVRHQCYR